jgi:glycosyltransferase involved in cell wall biosynthesis
MSIKVLHIIAGDLSGGAARGAHFLHQGLLDCGVESKILIQTSNEYDSNVQAIITNRFHRIMKIFQRYLDNFLIESYRNRENIIFSTGMVGYDIRKYDVYQWADIIHLHWINNSMINIKLLKKIDKPIVWTMRDMWPMTGGCHLAMECQGYKTSCGYCPQLGSKSRFDLSWYILKRKKRYYPKKLNLIAVSKWLAECAYSSDLFKGSDVRIIHNGIDTQAFFPIDREIARDLIGLPKHRKIVLVGAMNIHENIRDSINFKKPFLIWIQNLCSFFLVE